MIGPGLGRDKAVLSNVEQLIGYLRKQDKPIPLVIDADGLHLITEKPDLIHRYEHCILTPNAMEFERLYQKVTGKKLDEKKSDRDAKQLAQQLSDELQVNILMKGHLDTICSPTNREAIQCGIDGSPRRCGGQGDLLAGALITCYYWTLRNQDKVEPSSPQGGPSSSAAQVAGYAASALIRTSTQSVFSKLGRSMISVDVLKEIGPTFTRLFEK